MSCTSYYAPSIIDTRTCRRASKVLHFVYEDYAETHCTRCIHMFFKTFLVWCQTISYYRKTYAGRTDWNGTIVCNSWLWHHVCLHLTYMAVYLWIFFYSRISSHAFTGSNWNTTGRNKSKRTVRFLCYFQIFLVKERKPFAVEIVNQLT